MYRIYMYYLYRLINVFFYKLNKDKLLIYRYTKKNHYTMLIFDILYLFKYFKIKCVIIYCNIIMYKKWSKQRYNI